MQAFAEDFLCFLAVLSKSLFTTGTQEHTLACAHTQRPTDRHRVCVSSPQEGSQDSAVVCLK